MVFNFAVLACLASFTAPPEIIPARLNKAPYKPFHDRAAKAAISPIEARKRIFEFELPRRGERVARTRSTTWKLQGIVDGCYVFSDPTSWRQFWGLELTGYYVDVDKGDVEVVLPQRLDRETADLFPNDYVPYSELPKYAVKEEVDDGEK